MTQRVPYKEAQQMAKAEGATVVLLRIQPLPQRPGWYLASIEVHSQSAETEEYVVKDICREERMTRQGADQRAEEVAEDHGAVAIGVSEVGPAEQQE
jgi:hypothetical protein